MPGSTFTITQTTGPGRRLQLRGWASPMKPFTLVGKQVTDKIRNSGNALASLHVYGPDEENTTCHGVWNDKFLGDMGDLGDALAGAVDQGMPDGEAAAAILDGVRVINCRRLAKVVNDIRIEGQQVRVSWLHLSRTGILKQFSQHWLTEQDVEWEMEFEWDSPDAVSIDEQPTPPVPPIDMADVAGQMSARASSLQQASYRPFAVNLGFWERIDLSVAAVYEASAQIDDLVSAGVVASEKPQKTLRMIAGTLSFIEAESGRLIDLLNSQPDRANISGDDLGVVTFIDALIAARLNRRMVREARETRHTAARHREAVLRELDPELLDVKTASDGDDLRDYSQTYYRTPDDWQGLGRFNRISGSRLSKGQVVFIPRKTAQRAA